MFRFFLTLSLILIPSIASAQWSLDTYIHAGQMNATTENKTDTARFLSLFSIAGSYYPTEEIGIRLGAGSLLGVLGPSFETSLALEYFPIKGVFRPFLRLGGRGIVNVGIECSNAHLSCKDLADANRADRPIGAFGPTLAGFVGELGAGMELKFGRWGLVGWGSYLVGPLNLGPAAPELSKGVYQGWMGTLALRLSFGRLYPNLP